MQIYDKYTKCKLSYDVNHIDVTPRVKYRLHRLGSVMDKLFHLKIPAESKF